MRWLKKAAASLATGSLLLAAFGPQAAAAAGRNLSGPKGVPPSLSVPSVTAAGVDGAAAPMPPSASPQAIPTGLPDFSEAKLPVESPGAAVSTPDTALDASASEIPQASAGARTGSRTSASASRAADSQGEHGPLKDLERIAPSQADPGGIGQNFARAADGSASRPDAPLAASVHGEDLSSARSAGLSDGSVSSRASAQLPAPKDERHDEEAPPLPRAYYLYLAALMHSSLAQAIITVLIPRLAYGHRGSVQDLILAQFPGLIAIVLGSGFGAWGVRKFGSKKLYIVANGADGLFFGLLSTGMAILAGSIPTLFYALFAFISSFFYGALRGVAERDINVRLLGQESQALLKKGFQSYYFVVSPVYLGTSIATGFLFDKLGALFFCAIGGAAAFVSAVLFAFLRTHAGGNVEEKGGDAASLPLRHYLAYLFFFGNHQEVFFLFFPFFALFLFPAAGLSGWFVGAYALGNWLLFLANWMADKGYLRKSAVRLGWRRWTLFGIATTIAFLGLPFLMRWAFPAAEMQPLTVVAGIPLDPRTILSVVSGVLLGTGNAAAQSEWTSYYQKRLFKDKQPRVFFRLTAASMAFCLVPFALFWAALSLFPGVSMALLLGLVSAGVTLAGIIVALNLPKNLEP